MPGARPLLMAPGARLIAHRGNSSEAPENTLPAFESAVAVGVDFVELDYLHSADGVPVVFHDLLLERTTDVVPRGLAQPRGTPVASRTLPQLRMLDAGRWFRDTFAGTRLPTLAETIEAITPRTCLMIERKSGDPATLASLLERSGAEDRVVVQAFDWFFLAELHHRAPHLPLGALGSGIPRDSTLDEIQAIGATLVGWNRLGLDERTIARFHERGLRVWSWTIDDPAEARRLVDAGLDGVITNVPRRMLPELRERPPRGE